MIQLPIITKWDLEQSANWGDGWCLACGAAQASLEDGRVTHECGECGEVAVVSAENLVEVARRIVE